MSTIVNSQHLILAGNGVGVSHDNTLSGNGTFESPLGALFPEVSHDSTLSGNGLTTPLTVNFPTILHDDTISGNGYTEALGALIPALNVNTDNTLTGDGNSTPLGLSSEQNLNKVTLGSTIVSSNKIQMMDNDGVVTVTPAQIRQWDSMTAADVVVNTATMSGDGTNELPLGIKNNAMLSGQYGSAYISNAGFEAQGQNNSIAKLGLTNYGSTPYLQLSNNSESETLYISDISRMKEAVNIKNSGDLWNGDFNRVYSALTAHNGITLVDASANDGSPTDFNNVYYQTQYYPSYSGISFATTPQAVFGGAKFRYIDYTSAGAQDSGTKFLLGGETLSHVTMTFNDTANFNLPWAGMSLWGQKDYVESITFVMPSNYSFESGTIQLKNKHGDSYYLTAESGCWYTVSKVYNDASDMTKFSWQLLNSGYSQSL